MLVSKQLLIPPLENLYATLKSSASAQERNQILSAFLHQIQVDEENLMAEADPAIRELRREVLLERLDSVQDWLNANQKIDTLRSRQSALFQQLIYDKNFFRVQQP